ncbi:MAG: hypothetical protein C0596_15225 [Marinilabiliales bacterium]|nr:MAG: hypothetical protein C0596_15225 [Marinilabiliales bacterium]
MNLKKSLIIIISLAICIPIFATDFVVTNTNDSGTGSLRYALQMAAFTNGPHSINFNIPTTDTNYDSETGVWTITPATTFDYIIKNDIIIDGTTQTTNQGNTNPNGPEIYLNGNSQAVNFCFSIINASEIEIKGFIISGFIYGIQMTGNSCINNSITGCYIGTNHNATQADGNYIGVEIITGADYNYVGGTNLDDRNIISGNEHIGIRLLDVEYCNVYNNYVGVDRTGTSAIPNYDGISLEGAAKYNNIGGAEENQGNLVSGNVAYGIPIFGAGAEGNIVAGNLIGTDISGTLAIPNTYGLLFDDGSYNNILGGDTEAERNILSGNSAYGVFIYNMGTNSNIVRGNLIGTDIEGTSAIPNAIGIVVDGAAFKHIIDNNIISGNLQQGIYINITGCDSTKIINNKIGVDKNNNPLGNASDCIRISQGPKYTLIGGSEETANTIAYNGGNGVYIMFDNDDNHLISHNAIYENEGLGIDLFPPGVNVNDDGDIDEGANQGMNFPEITELTYSWGLGQTNITGHLDTPDPELCEIQIFAAEPHESGHGQATEYITSVNPDASGNWFVTLPVEASSPEGFITTLAIDKDNNTSEFSITQSSTTVAEISNIKTDNSFRIYPNPASDILYVEANKNFVVEIYNSSSQLLIKQTKGILQSIDISKLSEGIYFVKITNDLKTEVYKLEIAK